MYNAGFVKNGLQYLTIFFRVLDLNLKIDCHFVVF